MKILFPPQGFVNVDISIEVVSFITVLIFSLLCIKNYKLNKDKKFMYLGSGFGLIAVAQLVVVITKIVLYSSASFIGMGGEIVVPPNMFDFITMFYIVGFFIYMAFTLSGLYTLYKNPKSVFERDSILIAYFLILVTIFSGETIHIFHITALIILSLIIIKYSGVYKKNKSKGTIILIAAFSGLALSNAIFIFARLMSPIYVTASLIALASYITLLILIVRILEHGKNNGKKKKQNGYNL
jgi:hypothetical protein